MRDHLCVGLRAEGLAFADQNLTQVRRVVDDAVVDDADPAVLAHLRVRVRLSHRPVSRPARVPDAGLAREPARKRRLKLAHASDLLADLAAPAGHDGDSGRVVPAVLQPEQALHQDRRSVLAADVGDDAAHVSSRSPSLRRQDQPYTIRRSCRADRVGDATSRSSSSAAMSAKISSFLLPWRLKCACRRLTNASTGSRYQPRTSATTRVASPGDRPVDAATRATSSLSICPSCVTVTANSNFLPEFGQETDPGPP